MVFSKEFCNVFATFRISSNVLNDWLIRMCPETIQLTVFGGFLLWASDQSFDLLQFTAMDCHCHAHLCRKRRNCAEVLETKN